MSRDLTNLYIDETFQYLTQISGSNQDILLDGVGNRITELDITASNAVSSSYALTASYALNSVPQVSASYATSASYALNADNSISASYSVTAVSSSFANVSISASYSNVADTSISSSYALTASYAESAIAENVTFDDTNFAYTASNVQIALQRLSDNKADISQLTSNVTTFPTNAAADIGGYFALVTSSVDARYNTTAVDVPTGDITTTGQPVASLVTDSYLFLGNPGIVNLNTNGQIRKVAGSGEATFYYEVYSRSGSVETLLTTSDNTPPVESTVYSEFSAAAILNNGTFTEDDRIVLKFYANRVPGGSNPSYQFQFGGDTPVRTLFPVPATVLVSPWNGQFTGDAGITGSLTVNGNSTVNGGFSQNILDTGSQNFRVGTNSEYLALTAGGYDPGSGWVTTAQMAFGGADQAFFQADNDFFIKNTNDGTGSVYVWSENQLTLRGDTGMLLQGSDFNDLDYKVTIRGYEEQNLNAPGPFSQKNFMNLQNMTFDNGLNYTNSSFSMQNYGDDTSNYKKAFVYEMFDSFGYNNGVEFVVGPKKAGMTIIPSGSGFGQQSYIEVNQTSLTSGTSFIKMAGPTVQIGDRFGYPNTTDIDLITTNGTLSIDSNGIQLLQGGSQINIASAGFLGITSVGSMPLSSTYFQFSDGTINQVTNTGGFNTFADKIQANGGLEVTGPFNLGQQTINAGDVVANTASLDLDQGKQGWVNQVPGDVHIEFANGGSGKMMDVLLFQSATGSNFTFDSSINWIGGSAPTIPVQNFRQDLVRINSYYGGDIRAEYVGTY